MLTLDTLNVMLAVSEEGMVEEVILTLLASPQLAVFFEKFPRLKTPLLPTSHAGEKRYAVDLKVRAFHRN